MRAYLIGILLGLEALLHVNTQNGTWLIVRPISVNLLTIISISSRAGLKLNI